MLETTEYPPGSPCWMDLTAADIDAAKAFYTAVFGWDAEDQMDGEVRVYTLFWLDGKRVAGGAELQPGQPGPSPSWTLFFTVDDVDAASARARELGAQVLMEPMTIEGVGRPAFLTDPTGAAFTLWQPDQHHGFEVVNVAGAPFWCDCNTRDSQAAVAFYGELFGWEVGPREGPGNDWRAATLGGEQVAGFLQMGDAFPDEVPAHWLVYFLVDDCDATASRAAAAGAMLTSEPMTVEGMRFVVIEDPQGAVFAVIEQVGG